MGDLFCCVLKTTLLFCNFIHQLFCVMLHRVPQLHCAGQEKTTAMAGVGTFIGRYIHLNTSKVFAGCLLVLIMPPPSQVGYPDYATDGI